MIEASALVGGSSGLSGLGVGGLGVHAGGSSAADHASFERVLGVKRHVGEASSETERESRARETAEQLVSTTLLEPLMKSVRESSQAAAPFAPSQAEKQFRGMMDAKVAESVVRRSGMPLVERLAQDLLRTGGAGALEVSG